MPGQLHLVPAMYGWMGTGLQREAAINGGKVIGRLRDVSTGYRANGHPGEMDGIGNGGTGVDIITRLQEETAVVIV